MKHLAVKKFEDFQHYSHRNPPWIKLYYRLLSDLDFKRLTEVQQIHLVLIWLLASRLDNKIPYDETYVRAAIGAKRRVDLKGLVDSGWLLVVDASTDASTGASNGRGRHASNGASSSAIAGARSPYAREEVTEGTERTTTPPPPRAREGFDASDLQGRLASDLDREALATLLSRVPNPHAWGAEIAASLDAMAGHVALTAQQLGPALRDYVGNGASERANLRQFRRYLEQAAHPVAVPGASSNGARTAVHPDDQGNEFERLAREARAREAQNA
jgi:hypothetical protein